MSCTNKAKTRQKYRSDTYNVKDACVFSQRSYAAHKRNDKENASNKNKENGQIKENVSNFQVFRPHSRVRKVFVFFYVCVDANAKNYNTCKLKKYMNFNW